MWICPKLGFNALSRTTNFRNRTHKNRSLRPGIEPWTFCLPGRRANHYTAEDVPTSCVRFPVEATDFCVFCFLLFDDLYHSLHIVHTNFRLFETERVCRRQFQIWWKWQGVLQTGKKKTLVLTQLSFQSHRLTFPKCFCRGERRKYAGKEVRLNQASNSQPPGHEFDTLTTEPAGRGSNMIAFAVNY